jgi:microcystin-dependent protein
MRCAMCRTDRGSVDSIVTLVNCFMFQATRFSQSDSSNSLCWIHMPTSSDFRTQRTFLIAMGRNGVKFATLLSRPKLAVGDSGGTLTTRRAILSVIGCLGGVVIGSQSALGTTAHNDPPQGKEDTSLEELKNSFSKFREEYTALVETVSVLSKTIPPIGSILACGTSATPDGWLFCDGKEYDGTDPQYKALFTAIGNSYGGANPRFKVPDFQGRTAMGSGQGAGLPLRPIGSYTGQEDHKLQGAELPNHTHSAHHHTWVFPGGGANVAAGGGYQSAVRAANSGALFGLPSPNGSRPDQTGGYITSDDGATGVASADVAQQAFEVIPPSCVINYLIRFK